MAVEIDGHARKMLGGTDTPIGFRVVNEELLDSKEIILSRRQVDEVQLKVFLVSLLIRRRVCVKFQGSWLFYPPL